ncbi:hypothetical protein D3870_08240 [Noviherbaspirillum cavernae]|uniref:Uncharacterized protein n=1 Tax=Noviherbaspirillum cavernae TaxID=2320862 RepID=A0A418X0K0_9BURK|nr:hypothetical protein [Noviherbaspirillum cavernae]RJG06006.1 hypothetical protein D3870_08240 [Noviherbaspirillum cavernae]
MSTLLGRRKAVVEHRTVDGGHPAPYPDMTDEQLYNYEMTFNVPKRTFDQPPVSAHHAREEPTWQAEFDANLESFDIASITAQAGRKRTMQRQPEVRPVEREASGTPLDLTKPVRTITTRHPVDIITTRARHPIYKVHGYIGDDDVVTVFTLDGRLSENSEVFLENVPEPLQLHLNIYPNRDPHQAQRYVLTQHDTREEADASATPGRIACVCVQLDA